MFFDIGPLELLALVIIGVLVFGPDKLPKVIQDVSRFIRKVRAFSDSAKEDIRKELGPEFKDFEFEDLNPRTFIRKNILDNDDLGLKEIRNGFDFQELTDDLTLADHDSGTGGAGRPSLSKGATGTSSGSGPDMRKAERLEPGERPPFDADAT
ncbi:translocase [Wenjunlia vitaminophila]|uniref:Sec-independent protein translocase protein TatB n=1 Tax=Wenjunlia vitaminophila TaxID=76728 RepID=A0A0T6LLY7_WENVI|nr:sec-independent translocase [Wenjunlia vitaminophila]KRV47078.1 translocase [Wenjunlia vitaminophila]